MPTPPKVLIIEDEIDFYNNCFGGWGKLYVDTKDAGIRTFADIELKTFEAIDANQLDLIILDLELLPGQLPDECMPLLEKLVQQTNYRLPIIVVSKRYNPATRSRILDLGGVDLIDKNKLLSNLYTLEEIGSGIVKQADKKRSQPFGDLENRIIAITTDDKNVGERIVENKKYAFYTKDGFEILLRSLLLDTAICPAYYFSIKPKPDLSPAFIADLMAKAESKNKLPFSELKSQLRKGAKELYDHDVKRVLLVEAPDYTLPKDPDHSTTLETVLYKKLEDLMQESIQTKKSLEEITGLKERFFELYNENPNVLSESQSYHFRVFLKEKESVSHRHSPESSLKPGSWHDNHFKKSLFLAFLIAIIPGIIAWITNLPISYIAGLSSIVFCVSAFLLIKNDPKNKYFRSGTWIISLIGIVNLLPTVETVFSIDGNTPNHPWSFLFKLGIQDNELFSGCLLAVAMGLYLLQYLIDRTSGK